MSAVPPTVNEKLHSQSTDLDTTSSPTGLRKRQSSTSEIEANLLSPLPSALDLITTPHLSQGYPVFQMYVIGTGEA